MHPTLDEALSIEIAQRIQSRAIAPFDNAYRAALSINGATYTQGFIVLAGHGQQPLEHAWVELGESIVDPTLPHLNRAVQEIYYFPAQRLSVKALKAAVEEAQEDYPEDEPLPIYGAPPYEYYGDVMLGGKDYLEAYQAAELKSKELN
jgi:hypothetical protein